MCKEVICLWIFLSSIWVIIYVFPQLRTEKNGIQLLINHNIESFITEKPFVLVKFYEPGSNYSNNPDPEYVKAAAALKFEGINVELATAYTDKKDESYFSLFYQQDDSFSINPKHFGIYTYPTYKFFYGSISEPIDFNERTSRQIVNRIKKMIKEPEILRSDEEFTAFLSKNQIAIVYFGVNENDQTHSTFKRLSMSYDEISFARVFSSELTVAQDVYDVNFVLYKQFDEKRNHFTSVVTLSNLKQWVEDKSFPIVIPFNDRAIKKVFQNNNPTLFLIVNGNEASIAAETAFSQVAKDNKGKVLFSISRHDDGFGYYQRLEDYLGVNTDNAPILMIVDAKDQVRKYQFPSNTITEETLTSFVNDFKADKLKVYQKSQEIPSINDEPVKIVVGKSFDDIVKNTTADVLVQFYSPWCKVCKEIAPIYEAVAKKLADNKNIFLAKINYAFNEVPGVSIKDFPTLKFFLRGKKDQPVDFERDITEKDILQFIKEKSSYLSFETKENL